MSVSTAHLDQLNKISGAISRCFWIASGLVLRKAKPIAKHCFVSSCNGESNRRAKHGDFYYAFAPSMAMSPLAGFIGKR